MEHLDYDTVNTLKDVMEDDFELLLETFVQDSAERIRTLRLVIQGADIQGADIQGTEPDAIRRTAHSFKGSSCNVGAMQLSALCSTLEKKAAENQLDGLVADLEAIEQEFAHVQMLLRALP